MTENSQIENPMGRPKSRPKTHHVKITSAAHEASRIAAGYSGESLVEYVSRIMEREANIDIDRYHEQRADKLKGEQSQAEET